MGRGANKRWTARVVVATLGISTLVVGAAPLVGSNAAHATVVSVRTPVVGTPGFARVFSAARPAVAARPNAIARAASAALWSLWYGVSEYDERLDELVPLVADAAGISAVDLARAWRFASQERMVVLLSALTQVGVPYRKFQANPGQAFDCSGLTAWAWSQVGVSLPRQSLKQIRMVRRSSRAAVQPADLLYYPGHVMLALGVGQAMVHSPNRGATVTVSPAIVRRVRWMKVGSPGN
ncbi:MAG: hypothetical protein RL219_1197 [Actinomycetota bacterium]|jgi:hypothetical protein